MKYREDKYGNKLSVLGFGCMRFKKKVGRIQMPYESFSAQFDKSSGIWELDGDTLTFSLGTDAETLTAETKLSEGEKTITVESDGEIITLTKIK